MRATSDQDRWTAVDRYLADRLLEPDAVLDAALEASAAAVLDGDDPSAVGVRRLFDLLAAEPRLSATAIQTVGEKGYDGFALAVMLERGF